MERGPSRELADPVDGERWVFAFSVDGDIRFISHRDTLRLFRRALVRAALPVRYTQGFNPHPRLSIPLPRSVGMASQDESIIVEFDRPIDGEEALRRLAQQTPGGLEMIRARRLAAGERLYPDLARYRLDLGETPMGAIKPRVRNLLESRVVRIERDSLRGAAPKSIDVRPYFVNMDVDNGAVTFTLRVTGHGTVRPTEVAELLGLGAESMNHRIRRLEVQWT